jgi:hypothetical protein
MKTQLDAPFTAEEVYRAVQQKAPLKALGPNGFSADFYQQNWDVVGPEVCRVVLHFFYSSKLDLNINATYIALIPKKLDPSHVSEFRPISLCNVTYKIISKVLANHLKKVLPQIISENQSVFIPGRLIMDNILAAYETLHSMHTRMWSKVGYMGVKLDMYKAYDRVKWDFLEAVMRKMEFSDRWVNLIMECVRSISYDILVNGQSTRHTRPSKGIRQGDPIFPYLFILVRKLLVLLLIKLLIRELL